MTAPILPGRTIGILGSGQLGRMLAIAARRMGYRIHVFSPDADSPTGQIADREWIAPYEDIELVRDFARSADVVTFEFENVPSSTAAACELHVPVRPEGGILHMTQHRLREKIALRDAGLPVTPFMPVRSLRDLQGALDVLGCPAVLKSAGWGYDGKGQIRINSPTDAPHAWAEVNVAEAILEAFIEYEMEVSVIAARGLDGSFIPFDVCENVHTHHILDLTVVPARCSSIVRETAVELARRIMHRFNVVGVLCVEFFVTPGGPLLINELAPRPHNSGHFSFDACVTSQFEQQLRAVCGLPLGSAALLRPAAAMANLLGDVWTHAGGVPDWAGALRHRDVKLHLYGKTEPRPGRKMGHLTAMAESAEEAARLVTAARAALTHHPRPTSSGGHLPC